MPSRDIVENAWKAFASHDADRIPAVFTEDAEWLAPPGNATALDGLIHRVREYMDTARGHRMVFGETT
ncbi:hypothetical protein ACFVYA_14660 [Amycolatopsis sp. NPDC058278]|uniref:hypothetical protein n=1 Tax=Amycolatopsis sp. NPDC058278 TaxID=3346417 RepID=UPI0036DD89B5